MTVSSSKKIQSHPETPHRLRERGMELFQEAFRLHGDLGVRPEAFIDKALGAARAMGEGLERLHSKDLYLAMAAAEGSSQAWRIMESAYGPLIRSMAKQGGFLPQEMDDLVASFWGDLLLPAGQGQASRISTYEGRSSLATWLAVTVSHKAVDERRKRTRQESALQTLGREAPLGARPSRPEEELIEAQAQRQTEEAARRALESLSGEERALLVLYYLDGLKLRELGRVLGVHEANVSRRLKRVRERLKKAMVQHLTRGGMTRREAEELLAEGREASSWGVR